MGIFVRKDSPYWQLLLPRTGQKPLRKPTKIPHSPSTDQQKKANRELAEVAYNAAMTALARGELGIETTRGPRLDEFWRKTYKPWLTTHYPKAVKETARVIETHFLPIFGSRRLEELTPDRIHAWIDTRTEVTPQSRFRELSHLRGLLTRAVALKVIDAHPLEDLDLAPAPSKEIVRYLTADEEGRLMAALTARDARERDARERANRHRLSRQKRPKPPLGVYMDALHPIVVLSLQTGMRRGEVFQAQWAAIDWQASTITVEWWTTKRDRRRAVKSRRIPLNQAAITALRTWHDQQGKPKRHTLIFPSRTGHAFTNLNSSWEQVLTDAAIEDFRWHDLRHTFASKLVQRGVSLYVVQKLMGHSSITTTMRYAHLAPDQGRAAVDLLT